MHYSVGISVLACVNSGGDLIILPKGVGLA